MGKKQRANEVVHHALMIGPKEALIETEHQLGNRLVAKASWLKPEDWHDILLSSRYREIRIVAIFAKEENKGAFTRLVQGIIKDGLVPVVVNPMGIMVAVMAHWGWRKSTRGFNEETRHIVYSPTKKWIERMCTTCKI